MRNFIIMFVLSFAVILLIPSAMAGYTEWLPNPNLNYGGGGWVTQNWEWGSNLFGCHSGELTANPTAITCGICPICYTCAYTQYSWNTGGTINFFDWSLNPFCGYQTYSSYAAYWADTPLETWGGNRDIKLVVRENNSYSIAPPGGWGGIMFSIYPSKASDPSQEEPDQAVDIYIVVSGLAHYLSGTCETTNPGSHTEMIKLQKKAYGDLVDCHDWAFNKTSLGNGWTQWDIDIDGIIRYMAPKYGWDLANYKIKRAMWDVEAGTSTSSDPLAISASTIDYMSMQVAECTNAAGWPDCNDKDGWYCILGGAKREYRDYYCSSGTCQYTVTSTQTCGDLNYHYCDGDTVKYMGYVCISGTCQGSVVGQENCNSYDGCNSGYYRDYYCSSGSCAYTSSCTETCCDQYYGSSNAYCSAGTCYPPCTNHAQCSQACTTLCPFGVYGCCFGCKLGQCISGACQCIDAPAYCSNNPPYQKGSQCISTTTSTTPTTASTTTTTGGGGGGGGPVFWKLLV